MLSRDELTQLIARTIKTGFSRSSGAGGQNVNKVNTKVSATLKLTDLPLLSEEEKSRLARNLKNRLSREGELRIQVQDERTQGRNLTLAVERLTDLIMEALHVPKKRRQTRVPAAVKHKRLETKKKTTEKKRRRRFTPDRD